MKYEKFKQILLQSVEKSDESEYRIKRFLENLEHDLPNLRGSLSMISYGFDVRGPNIPVARQSTFFASTLKKFPLPETKNQVRQASKALLYRLSESIESDGLGSCVCPHNEPNRVQLDDGTLVVTYMRFSKFSQFLPNLRTPRNPESRFPWPDLKERKNEFVTALGEFKKRANHAINLSKDPKSGKYHPFFVVPAEYAPHRDAGIQLGSVAAAWHVARRVALPRLETEESRTADSVGLVSLEFPAKFLSAIYRPTAFDVVQEGHFFCPAIIGEPHGRTWPLLESLQRHDPETTMGVPELIVQAEGDIPLEEIDIDIIGLL